MIENFYFPFETRLTSDLWTPLAPKATCTMAPRIMGERGRKERDQPSGIPHSAGREMAKVARGSTRWSRDSCCRRHIKPPYTINNVTGSSVVEQWARYPEVAGSIPDSFKFSSTFKLIWHLS